MARPRLIETDVETPPEADRLEGWPHPRETREVVGHEAVEASIAGAIASHRFHHAWLMTGEQGIGKASFAYRFTRFMLAQQADLPNEVASLDVGEDAKAYRQVTSQSHPGLLTIRRTWEPQGKRFRQSIAIDDIRALRHFLQRTAVTPWRVVIVDSADDLNQNSANALLKSLEEPPQRTVFLLISSSPGRLLPTIRSRCRTIRFEPLNDDHLRQAVTAACAASGRDVPAADQLDTLLNLAKGSPRRALQLLDGGGLPLFQSVLSLLESLPRLDRPALHKLLALTSSRDGLAHDTALDLLDDLMADTIRACAAGASARRAFPQLRRFPLLVAPESLADWAELWETMREARSETDRLNLNKAALTLTVFEKIERLSRKAARDGL
jgi:DNA polymerase-3 subunit delta'